MIREKKLNLKERGDKQRLSVSAEAYGIYNQKEIYIPKMIFKTEEQKERISKKILESILFKCLDESDVGTVINAMEEKKLK